MSWHMLKQKNIQPDFEMVDNILKKLNGVFDAYDFYHHSNTEHEMFEFTYQKDDYRREAWQITFMGKTVASGGDFGLDDFYEDDYVFLIKENAEKIYNCAYHGAIDYVVNILKYVSYSEISKDFKEDWINTINNGIKRIEEDKKNEHHYWSSDDKLLED